jgi:hypothetical protein
MKRSLFILLLIPVLAYAQVNPQDGDWKLSVTARGTLSSGETFESVGVATFSGLDNLLSARGGFKAAYRDFQKENQLTYGVWQEAEAFRDYLKACNIDVPTDLLAMKLGLNRVFSSQDDQELNQMLNDLGQNLSFEKKVEFASRLGGMLAQGYDYKRAGSGPETKGIVTLRDMINARNSGKDAGVCRDMSQALAQSLKQMGVKDAYVITYNTVGDGHATVLVQDPNDPSKTFNINYNYVTSTESGSALSHLKQDSTIPSIGIQMKVFDADGKPLAALPTHLGVLLHEMVGGQASDLDPLLRSENQIAGAQYRTSNNLVIGAGAGMTPDGDKVVAASGSYIYNSEHFPMKMSVVLYNNERETDLRGKLSSTGMVIEGEQRLISDPLKFKTGNGTLSMNLEGRVGIANHLSYSALEVEGPKRSVGAESDMTASAAVRTHFQSMNEGTKAQVLITANGGLAKSDVRDEGSNSFNLRDVAGTLQVSQKIASNLNGFADATVVMRPEFGVQSVQAMGISRENDNGSSTFLSLTHEGSVSGNAPAFIPGAREKYSVDVRQMNEKYGVGGGVFCRKLADDRKDCGLSSTATIKLGGRGH